MPTLHIYQGLPGSGKSTAALAHLERSREDMVERGGNPDFPGLVRVNRDLLRQMLHGGNQQQRPDGAMYENQVTIAQEATIQAYLERGINVVTDDCNLRPSNLCKLARMCHAQIVFHSEFLDVPLEVCLERNRSRTGTARVPEQVIERMHAKAVKLGLITEEKN